MSWRWILCALLVWAGLAGGARQVMADGEAITEVMFADTVWTTPLPMEAFERGRNKDGERWKTMTVALFVSGHFIEQSSVDCEPGDTLKDAVISRAGRWRVDAGRIAFTYEREWIAQSAACTEAPREGISIDFKGHTVRKTAGAASGEGLSAPKGKIAEQGASMTLRAGEAASNALKMSHQSSAEAFIGDYRWSNVPPEFIQYFGCTKADSELQCPRQRTE